MRYSGELSVKLFDENRRDKIVKLQIVYEINQQRYLADRCVHMSFSQKLIELQMEKGIRRLDGTALHAQCVDTCHKKLADHAVELGHTKENKHFDPLFTHFDAVWTLSVDDRYAIQCE